MKQTIPMHLRWISKVRQWVLSQSLENDCWKKA